MALRPAKSYRTPERPYTRQSKRKPRKGYVKGVPDSKIHRFETGIFNPKFSLRSSLVVEGNVQIRDNALEAARIAANKFLDENVGKDNYFMKILVYPHHVLRENPLATGAGADRFQTGMRKAFGKPIGVAAIVRKNQKLMDIWTYKEKKDLVKKALKIAGSKIPSSSHVVYELREAS